MLKDNSYIVATLKPWNIKVYDEVIKWYPGKWHLITEPNELSIDTIKSINPKYIFFPHWSDIVPKEIIYAAKCICFHETDLPYGRGGSPIQNLIDRGYKKTVITAFRMTEELDAGPVYLKNPLSLEGSAEEIFLRTAYTIAGMIKTIIMENPAPKPQSGKSVVFKRRKPEQSKISSSIGTLSKMFDHIRMLDAEGYPKAFIEVNGFRYEFTRATLKTDKIIADVRITKIKETVHD